MATQSTTIQNLIHPVTDHKCGCQRLPAAATSTGSQVLLPAAASGYHQVLLPAATTSTGSTQGARTHTAAAAADAFLQHTFLTCCSLHTFCRSLGSQNQPMRITSCCTMCRPTGCSCQARSTTLYSCWQSIATPGHLRCAAAPLCMTAAAGSSCVSSISCCVA